MSYVKQSWENLPSTATPITAERLTHIENGVKANSDAVDALNVPHYGTWLSLVTQPATAVNVPQIMKFEETYMSQNISMVDDSNGHPTELTFANAGVYNIQFSAELKNTSGGGSSTNSVWIWLRVNHSDAPYSNTEIHVYDAQVGVAAWNWYLDVAAGTSVQLMWMTNDPTTSIYASTATGQMPGIPSLILTAHKVG